ncbi:hypothetical protein HOH45_04510 [bacterium]|jgi:hypothetical protein|nr:hypothetical protein [bacterium]
MYTNLPGAYRLGGTSSSGINAMGGVRIGNDRDKTVEMSPSISINQVPIQAPLGQREVRSVSVAEASNNVCIEGPLTQNQLRRVSVSEESDTSRLYNNYNSHGNLKHIGNKFSRSLIIAPHRSPDGDSFRGIGNVMSSVFWGVGVAASGFTFGMSLLVFGGIAVGIKGVMDVVAASADKDHKNEYDNLKYPEYRGYEKSRDSVSLSYNFLKGSIKGFVSPLILLYQFKNLYDTRELVQHLSSK